MTLNHLYPTKQNAIAVEVSFISISPEMFNLWYQDTSVVTFAPINVIVGKQHVRNKPCRVLMLVVRMLLLLLLDDVRSVAEQDKEFLQRELFTYMKDLLFCNTSGAVSSFNLMHEFTTFHIKQVLDNCDKIKTLQHVEEFVEVWRKEHGRAILAAISKVFGDIDSNELQVPESMEEESYDLVEEWEDIRDVLELCQLLVDSDFQDTDVYMSEIDQAGNDQRSISSMIDNLFR